MLCDVSAKDSIDHELAHSFVIIRVEFFHPVVLFFTHHELKRRRDVMGLKHANVVVPQSQRIFNVAQKNVVYTRVLVIMDARGNV